MTLDTAIKILQSEMIACVIENEGDSEWARGKLRLAEAIRTVLSAISPNEVNNNGLDNRT